MEWSSLNELLIQRIVVIEVLISVFELGDSSNVVIFAEFLLRNPRLLPQRMFDFLRVFAGCTFLYVVLY